MGRSRCRLGRGCWVNVNRESRVTAYKCNAPCETSNVTPIFVRNATLDRLLLESEHLPSANGGWLLKYWPEACALPQSSLDTWNRICGRG